MLFKQHCSVVAGLTARIYLEKWGSTIIFKISAPLRLCSEYRKFLVPVNDHLFSVFSSSQYSQWLINVIMCLPNYFKVTTEKVDN